MILDDGVAAREPMLVAQTLENPLGRMTLLHRRCPVSIEDRIDHRNQAPQLRLLRWSLPHITRRHREPAHLRDCLSAQPKNTSRFPPALAIIENKLPNRRVNLHDKHPFGFPSSRRQRNALPLAGFYSAAAAHRRRSSGLLFHRRAHSTSLRGQTCAEVGNFVIASFRSTLVNEARLLCQILFEFFSHDIKERGRYHSIMRFTLAPRHWDYIEGPIVLAGVGCIEVRTLSGQPKVLRNLGLDKHRMLFFSRPLVRNRQICDP